MATLYQCAMCDGITNTTWKVGDRNLCRACFGREKLGTYGTDDIKHESSLRLVRGDGTIWEIDTLSGRPVGGKVAAGTIDVARPVRKIRILAETQK